LPLPLRNKNVVPVVMDNKKIVRETVASRGNTPLSFSIKQFPLMLLAAITVHKVQGLTLPGVIIDDLLAPGYQREGAYVVCS
jgi:hypothetical protein